MSDPTIHDLFVAFGGDPDVTDPTIQQMLDAAVAAGEGGAGGGAISVTDGETTVENVTTLVITGAAVTAGVAGVAQAAVPTHRPALVGPG